MKSWGDLCKKQTTLGSCQFSVYSYRMNCANKCWELSKLYKTPCFSLFLLSSSFTTLFRHCSLTYIQCKVIDEMLCVWLYFGSESQVWTYQRGVHSFSSLCVIGATGKQTNKVFPHLLKEDKNNEAEGWIGVVVGQGRNSERGMDSETKRLRARASPSRSQRKESSWLRD